MKEEKPSEVIDKFLAYLEQCKSDYEENFTIVGEEDKRLQDMLHAIEFSPCKQDRNKVATKFQQSRKRRRRAKDKVLELEKIYGFCKDQSNRPALKKLKGVVASQRDTEAYLDGEREYRQRVGDNVGDNNNRR